MRKLVAFIIAFIVLLSTPAFTAGKLIVDDKKYYIESWGPENYLTAFVKVKNIGDRSVRCYGGSLEVFDQNGNSLEIITLYSCFPTVIGPGKDGYMSYTPFEFEEPHSIIMEEGSEINYIDKKVLTIRGYDAYNETVKYLRSEGEFLEMSGRFAAKYLISAKIYNDTDSIINDVNVIFTFYDSDDNFLYADFITPQQIGVPAGSSVIFYAETMIPVTNWWEEHRVTPARIETIAYRENTEYNDDDDADYDYDEKEYIYDEDK